MPVIPNVLERTYMLRLNRGPGPMLDLFGGMSLEAALLGLDLGVFAVLEDGPASAEYIVKHLDIDETGLETLLRFLARSGYVYESDGRFALTPMSERWLLEDSEDSYARYFRFWRDVLYPYWREHAEESIRTGRPAMSVYDWLDEHPDRWPIAQAAFESTAEQLGDDIAEFLDVPKEGSVLDVGGGHALYSIALCDRYPTALATVIDTPAMAEIARENVEAALLDDRITFEATDFETESINGEYDLILAFNIVHGNDPETNQELMATLSDALAPDGRLAILDQFGDDSRATISNTGTRFLDLTYFVSLGGRTYHTDTVRSWLQEVGMEETGRQDFTDRNMTLVVAEPE